MTPKRVALWTAAGVTLACVFISTERSWLYVAIFYAFVLGLVIGRRTKS